MTEEHRNACAEVDTGDVGKLNDGPGTTRDILNRLAQCERAITALTGTVGRQQQVIARFQRHFLDNQQHLMTALENMKQINERLRVIEIQALTEEIRREKEEQGEETVVPFRGLGVDPDPKGAA